MARQVDQGKPNSDQESALPESLRLREAEQAGEHDQEQERQLRAIVAKGARYVHESRGQPQDDRNGVARKANPKVPVSNHPTLLSRSPAVQDAHTIRKGNYCEFTSGCKKTQRDDPILAMETRRPVPSRLAVRDPGTT
jgi:hypothetical protein